MTVNEARIEHEAWAEAWGSSTPFDPSSIEIPDLIKLPHAQTKAYKDHLGYNELQGLMSDVIESQLVPQSQVLAGKQSTYICTVFKGMIEARAAWGSPLGLSP